MAKLHLSKLYGSALADAAADLRGLKVLAASGETLGTVRELIVNTETEVVESVLLDTGVSCPLRRVERDGNVLRVSSR